MKKTELIRLGERYGLPLNLVIWLSCVIDVRKEASWWNIVFLIFMSGSVTLLIFLQYLIKRLNKGIEKLEGQIKLDVKKLVDEEIELRGYVLDESNNLVKRDLQ